MATSLPIRGRLAELLAGEAAGDLDREERVELERLLAQGQAAGREQLMTAGGIAQMAFLRQDRAAHSAMPEALRARLARQSEAWAAGRRASGPAPVADLDAARRRRQEPLPPGRRPGVARSAAGWLVAAALGAVMLAPRLLPGPETAPADVSAEARRAALVREAPDLLQLSWAASAEPGFEQARGDVVWSSARQEGYLRLSGLPANDPRRAQYQLWVVDASRDVHPVDGGVFDIAANGEAVIPIHAKLPVSRPTAFAVTREQPGGVVVSDGPMLLVAAAGG